MWAGSNQTPSFAMEANSRCSSMLSFRLNVLALLAVLLSTCAASPISNEDMHVAHLRAVGTVRIPVRTLNTITEQSSAPLHKLDQFTQDHLETAAVAPFASPRRQYLVHVAPSKDDNDIADMHTLLQHVSGGRVSHYIPSHNFVVHLNPSEIQSLLQHPRVLHVAHFRPDYKVHPDLTTLLPARSTLGHVDSAAHLSVQSASSTEQIHTSEGETRADTSSNALEQALRRLRAQHTASATASSDLRASDGSITLRAVLTAPAAASHTDRSSRQSDRTGAHSAPAQPSVLSLTHQWVKAGVAQLKAVTSWSVSIRVLQQDAVATVLRALADHESVHWIEEVHAVKVLNNEACLLYTSPSPRD